MTKDIHDAGAFPFDDPEELAVVEGGDDMWLEELEPAAPRGRRALAPGLAAAQRVAPDQRLRHLAAVANGRARFATARELKPAAVPTRRAGQHGARAA